MKVCRQCRKEKPVEEYYKHPATRDGLFSKCKDCHRAETSERIQKRRQYAAAIKVESGCVDCGWTGAPELLDFDHIDPKTKRFDVSRGCSNAGQRALDAEIAKCVVRCKPCHEARTLEQQLSGVFNAAA